MTEVRVLDSAPISDATVPLLEDMLERAKAGQLSSVAVAVVYRDGSTGDAWSNPPSVATLIGAVTIMQTRLVAVVNSKDD